MTVVFSFLNKQCRLIANKQALSYSNIQYPSFALQKRQLYILLELTEKPQSYCPSTDRVWDIFTEGRDE